jgi:hypothetical protein
MAMRYGRTGKKQAKNISNVRRTTIMEPLSDKLAWNRKARRIIAGVAKFVFSMLVMTIICEFAWETCVVGKIYCDSDEDFGYLTPGNWVSNWDGHPIAIVHQIPAVRQYGDPDVIIEGWSITGLWCIWIIFFGISLFVSIVFAWVQWFSFLSKKSNK